MCYLRKESFHTAKYVLTTRTAYPRMPFYLIYASGLQLPQLTSLPIILKPRTRQAKSESSIRKLKDFLLKNFILFYFIKLKYLNQFF